MKRRNSSKYEQKFLGFLRKILGYSNRYYGGVLHHRLNRKSFTLKLLPIYKLPMKITAHIGAVIPIAGNRDGTTYISPNFLYQKQRDFQQYNIGLYVAKAPLVGGLWYRGGMLSLHWLDFNRAFFKFGYSYDVTVSKLYNASAGSHELSLGLQFPCHPKRRIQGPLSALHF